MLIVLLAAKQELDSHVIVCGSNVGINGSTAAVGVVGEIGDIVDNFVIGFNDSVNALVAREFELEVPVRCDPLAAVDCCFVTEDAALEWLLISLNSEPDLFVDELVANEEDAFVDLVVKCSVVDLAVEWDCATFDDGLVSSAVTIVLRRFESPDVDLS